MEVKVCAVSDIGKGTMKLVNAGNKAIVIANADEKFYAFQQKCTHKGGPLDEGFLQGKTVTCPWHGAEFDIETGNALSGPAKGDIAIYKVVVKGNDVFVEV